MPQLAQAVGVDGELGVGDALVRELAVLGPLQQQVVGGLEGEAFQVRGEQVRERRGAVRRGIGCLLGAPGGEPVVG